MNIYVGNIPYAMEENELREIFGAYGHVTSLKIIMDRETGRSRGFGFIEMGDEGARKAIAELNGAEHHGKQLSVKEAREKNDSDRKFNSRRPF